MGQCFEIYRFESYVREFRDGVAAPLQKSNEMLILPPEGEDTLNDILKPFDLNEFVFLLGLDNSFISSRIALPWAIIAFRKEYRLAGHFCQIRGDSSKLLFTHYSGFNSDPPENFVPPLSCILVAEKQALEKAASKSPLLSSAWQLLKDKAEEQHWLCIPDSPSEDWVRQNELGDDDLFRRLIDIKKASQG
jgi:hypothetical protein